MSCPYKDNLFCGSMSPETREQLCAACHIRIYPKNMVFSQRKWHDRLAVLADGLTAIGGFEQIGKPSACRTSGIASTGSILSLGMSSLMEHSPTYAPYIQITEDFYDSDNICVLDSAVAVFDNEVASRLFSTDINFVLNLMLNLRYRCGMETGQFVFYQSSAYQSVRFVVDYCRRHGITELTHAQIALLCNRTRPVATKTLRQLIADEPELFGPAAGTPGHSEP